MSTTSWDWPGAKWWRCDLHTHSPAPGSDDWRGGKDVSASDWIDAVVKAGIQVVALTDHNGGKNVDAYKAAGDAKGVVVLPGVELTVRPGVHLLAIFGPSATSDHVNTFVGKAGIAVEKWGKAGEIAEMDLLPALALARDSSALTIAAHVDEKNGVVFEHVAPNGNGGALVGSKTLIDTLQSEHLDAVEVKTLDSECLAFLDGSKPAYKRTPRPLTQVRSSDAHRLDEIGQRSTWIKMSKADREGLAFALWDGDGSVRPHDAAGPSPNDHAALVVEQLVVARASRMGHGTPLVVRLNPWLNAIIGGRGSGKSTLVEFLRLACGRRDEVPKRLESEKQRYFTASKGRGGDGLLREDSQIEVYFRKDHGQFRVVRTHLRSSLEELRNGEWVESKGDIKERFPVRIYGQKEVFELANDPGALLTVIDGAPAIEKGRWRDRWNVEEQRFYSLRARVRELGIQLGEEPRILAELEDLGRRLGIFEKSGHVRVLKAFGRSRRQEASLEDVRQAGGKIVSDLRAAQARLSLPDLDPELFSSDDADEAVVLAARATLDGVLSKVRDALTALATETDQALAAYDGEVVASSWWARVRAARAEYEAFTSALASQGVDDPGEYGRLVQQRAVLEARLKELQSLRTTMQSHEKEATESLERLRALRRELTAARKAFLARHGATSRHVRLRVIPYGRLESVEREFRDLVRREEGFGNDIGTLDGERKGLLGDAFGAFVSAIEEGAELDAPVAALEGELDALKRRIIALSQESSPKKGSFAGHLQEKVKPADLDRLLTWFPEDSVEASYSPEGNGAGFRPIAQGSPGQRTAALLAFLMSYGTDPLILDQPEDDLDNELIHSLIVQQLRALKSTRQIIVVTHNPNIVVNAAAELVVALEVRAGQTTIRTNGALQESPVRDAVCKIMEGGEQALKERYRRILGAP